MRTIFFVITTCIVFYSHGCYPIIFADGKDAVGIQQYLSSASHKDATELFVNHCAEIDPRIVVFPDYFGKGKSFLQAAEGNAELVAYMLKKIALKGGITNSRAVIFLGSESWSDWLLFFTKSFCDTVNLLSIIEEELIYFKQVLDIIYENLGPTVFSDSLAKSVHKRFWGIPELMYMEDQIIDVLKAYRATEP